MAIIVIILIAKQRKSIISTTTDAILEFAVTREGCSNIILVFLSSLDFRHQGYFNVNKGAAINMDELLEWRKYTRNAGFNKANLK